MLSPDQLEAPGQGILALPALSPPQSHIWLRTVAPILLGNWGCSVPHKPGTLLGASSHLPQLRSPRV